MELMRSVVLDHGDLGLGQLHIVQLASHEQIVSAVGVFNGLDVNGVEELHVRSVPVVGVLGQDLFILMYVVGDGVGAVVPQIFVGGAEVTINTDFLDQLSGQRSQAVVASQGGEVVHHGQGLVGDGLVVGAGHANHLIELIQLQSLGFFFRQSLGVLIVLGSAFDHLDGHRGVGRVILVEVQNPFKASGEVFRNAVSLDVALPVNPLDTFVQLESPNQAGLIDVPGVGDRGLQTAVGIVGQQVIVAVGQNVQVVRLLRVLIAERFHFRAGDNVVQQLSDFRLRGQDHGEAQHHGQSQDHGQNLLHSKPPLIFDSGADKDLLLCFDLMLA